MIAAIIVDDEFLYCYLELPKEVTISINND